MHYDNKRMEGFGMKKIYWVSCESIEIYLNKIGKSWRGFNFETDLTDDVVREIADKVMSVEDFCKCYNHCQVPNVSDYYCRAL